MFARDRDLLVHEPGLLGAVAWVGQRLVSGEGSVSGTGLVLTAHGGGLLGQGVGPGSVVSIGGAGYEVVSVVSESSAVVSGIRASVSDDPIAPPEMVGVDVAVYTFAPQIADVHRRVLRMLGLEPGVGRDEPGEPAVVNPGALARLEALGALHMVYAGASAGGAGGESALSRAEMYRRRFADERARVVALLDLDGDGVADTARRPGVGLFVRG